MLLTVLPGAGFSASDIAGAASGKSRARAQPPGARDAGSAETIIADVEAQRRGYLLTLDPSYLKAYGVSDESVRRDGAGAPGFGSGASIAAPSCRHLALTVASKAARDR